MLRFKSMLNLKWQSPPSLRHHTISARNCSGIALITFFFCTLFALPASAATWTVTSQPPRLVNGAPVLFQVKPPAKLELPYRHMAHPPTHLQLRRDLEDLVRTGRSTLRNNSGPVRNRTNWPTCDRQNSRLPSRANSPSPHFPYPQIKVQLTVEKKFTEPNPEQLQQAEESNKIKQDYLNRVTADREWDGNFAAPAEAAISDVYGSQRIFNGKAQREHQGLDFRVPTGTPVVAMNSGTVLLARFLYYEGNCVVIDHGQGLLTLYFHLSEFKVKEGDVVKRGQEIGLSGGTGRATGPHLHVGVRWQGKYLDPARLFELRLP